MRLQELTEGRTINPNDAKLMMQKARQLEPVLHKGGFPVVGENLYSKREGQNPEQYDDAFQWFKNKGKNPGVAYGEQPPAAESETARLIATLGIMQRRQRSSMDIAVQISGLDREKIEAVMKVDGDAVQQAVPAYRPGWLKDPVRTSFTPEEWKTKSKEEKKAAIRAAMEKISGGMPGTVASNDIAQTIGLDRRAVDRILSDDPDMRDLERFRKVGKQAGTTDADREVRGRRNMRKAGY